MDRMWLFKYSVSLNTGCSISVSPCSPNPCLNDGSCTVDIYGEAVCTCNGEWTDVIV
jgi:hypothetical protein